MILARATHWVETGEMLESDKRPGTRYHPGPHEDWLYKWGDNPNRNTRYPKVAQ